MNERTIQHSLFTMLGSASELMIPNYTPAGWWECDMLRVTKAGLAHEFEIKVSASDFRADARKADEGFAIHHADGSVTVKEPRTTKHELLASGHHKGPSRFWFAMPAEIAAKVTIPAFAGLITFQPGYSWGAIQKPAPKLHGEKMGQGVIKHAHSVFYWRYWQIRRGKEDAP